MNTMIKLLVTLFCLNIFMYIGVNFAISADGNSLNENYNFHFQGDLITTYLEGYDNLDQITQDTKDNWTNYGVGLNASFSAFPDKASGEQETGGGVTFLDSLNIVWSFAKTLGNIIIAPLTLFFNFRMPIFIGLMVGLPYFFVLVLTLFAFIRGVGD